MTDVGAVGVTAQRCGGPAVPPRCPCCVPALGPGCGSASAHRDPATGLEAARAGSHAPHPASALPGKAKDWGELGVARRNSSKKILSATSPSPGRAQHSVSARGAAALAPTAPLRLWGCDRQRGHWSAPCPGQPGQVPIIPSHPLLVRGSPGARSLLEPRGHTAAGTALARRVLAAQSDRAASPRTRIHRARARAGGRCG